MTIQHILLVNKNLQNISPCRTWELWNVGWPPPSCAAPFPGQSLWSVLIGPSAPRAPSPGDWPRYEPAAPTPAPSRCPHSVGDDAHGVCQFCLLHITMHPSHFSANFLGKFQDYWGEKANLWMLPSTTLMRILEGGSWTLTAGGAESPVWCVNEPMWRKTFKFVYVLIWGKLLSPHCSSNLMFLSFFSLQ